MERKKLSDEEMISLLGQFDRWMLDGGRIKKRYEFGNFAEALAFVNKVGAIAEELDHHPDITFGWGYAEIATTTHDQGGVTDVDFALAKMIDQV